MALEKLIILADSGQTVIALFNPNTISIQKTVNWRPAPAPERDVPAAHFTHGDAATLSMDLLFDTYENGTDVRQFTRPVVNLTTVEQHGEIHRPPVCQLFWGLWGLFFEGVLENLRQQFTLFLADGTPVRATLSCTFKEWRSDQDEALRQDRRSADVAKQYTVRQGDTLSSIAAREYKDPALWRPIATANRIDNPRRLATGQILTIPALRKQSGRRK